MDYENKKYRELQKLAADRGVRCTGRKVELIKRLCDWDKERENEWKALQKRQRQQNNKVKMELKALGLPTAGNMNDLRARLEFHKSCMIALEERGLPTEGNTAQLIDRLEEYKQEQEKKEVELMKQDVTMRNVLAVVTVLRKYVVSLQRENEELKTQLQDLQEEVDDCVKEPRNSPWG